MKRRTTRDDGLARSRRATVWSAPRNTRRSAAEKAPRFYGHAITMPLNKRPAKSAKCLDRIPDMRTCTGWTGAHCVGGTVDDPGVKAHARFCVLFDTRELRVC